MTGAERSAAEQLTITVCTDGALLAHRPAALQTADGAAVDHDRRVSELCRCGQCGLQLLSHSAHHLSKFRDAESATRIRHVHDNVVPDPMPDPRQA